MKDLRFLGHIGSGSCGQVHKVCLRGKVMAVKNVTITEETKDQVEKDISTLSRTRGYNHIVTHFGYLKHNRKVFLCMEWMLTCVHNLIYNEQQEQIHHHVCAKITKDVLQALEYLLTNYAIIHQDVKPTNILLDVNGGVKLCDFGTSGQGLVDGIVKVTKPVGSLYYMSPELFTDKPPLDERSDVWSLGITVFEMSHGKHPYGNKPEFVIPSYVRKSNIFVENSQNIPETCRDFINVCLAKRIEDRPNFNQLKELSFVANTKLKDLSDWIYDFMRT